jgi:hypothetical protein
VCTKIAATSCFWFSVDELASHIHATGTLTPGITPSCHAAGSPLTLLTLFVLSNNNYAALLCLQHISTSATATLSSSPLSEDT